MESTHYELHNTTRPALEKMRGHKTSYEVSVAGITITVMPGVWSPAYDWSADFVIANFPNVEGKEVLEIGCGSGLISVHAALSGARYVTAVDINPLAVENTATNFARHGISSCTAVVSNGFAKVQGQFDVIVFNAPYHGCKPEDMLEYACADESYQTLRAFFADLEHHLITNGKAEVGFSESGDLRLFRELIEVRNFAIQRELSEWRDGYNCMLFELVR